MRILDPAESELIEAISYYDKQLAGLGRAFLDETWQAIQRVRKFPMLWSPIGKDIRRCQLRRFPYGIIYEPSSEEIVVIAIAHLRRRPGYWRSRVPNIQRDS